MSTISISAVSRIHHSAEDRCILLVSSGNGPAECQQAVGHLIAAIAADAARSGPGFRPGAQDDGSIEVDICERPGPAGPTSAIVILEGAGARALGLSWVGLVLWRCQSSLRAQHRRKNWFVQIFELETAAGQIEISPVDVEMQAIRAGGPGGQHVNKTSSAIRARWRDTSGRTYNVVVRDHRSQHRNRKIAIERLGALAAADALQDTASRASRKSGSRHLHHHLQRGNPSRSFEGPDFRPA